MTTFKSLVLKLSAIIVISTFCVDIIKAQSTLNFYTIRDGWEQYYQQNPELKSTPGSGYKDFKRWERFWMDRTYGFDTNRTGDFSLYGEALTEYLRSKSYYDNSSFLAPNWKFAGPSGVTKQVNGLVNAVYVDTVNDPGYNTILVGTNSSGIWKTNDGGNNWSNVTDYGDFNIPGINCIAGDPNNGNIYYASTGGSFPFSCDGYGIGLIKSTDNGNSWFKIFPPSTSESFSRLVSHKILVDPTDPERIFALVYNRVIRSADGGQNWDTIFTAPCDIYIIDTNIIEIDIILRDIEMKPGESDILYVSSDYRHWAGQQRPHVWKITNATDSNPDSTRMDNLFPGYKNFNERFEVAVSPASPSSVWVIGNDTSRVDTIINTRVKIWQSDNNGQTWSLRLDQPPGSLGPDGGGINYFRMELLVSPTDTGMIYIGGYTMSRLTHWNMNSILITPYDSTHYHIDTRDAVIVRGTNPVFHGTNDVIFAGNDGGVSETTDGIQNWTNINGEGLNITQFWGIGSSNENPQWLGGGTQDNSFFVRDPVLGWLHTGGGDMGNVLIDFENPSTIFSSQWIWFGREVVTKSDDSGKTWPDYNFVAVPENWIANWPFIMNPKNPKSLYVGAHNIYKTTNSIDTFTKIPMQLNGDTNAIAYNETLCKIAIPQADTTIIYACYSGPHWNHGDTLRHKLLKTEDSGVTWQDLTDHVAENQHEVFESLGLTSIEISPTNKDSVWITFGGFWSTPGKFRSMVSSDGGDTWSDYSQGLPNLPVNCLKYWRNGEGGLFLGNDVGVFHRGKNDSIWQSFNTGLPSLIVSDIEVNDSIDVLRIGTYGRGIWEADLTCGYKSDTLLITSDTTWSTDFTMDQSFKVKQGATLTIMSTIKFPPQAKIYIEPGAALMVEGGTLTNSCFGMWQGIEVWGNAGLLQNTANQGYLYLGKGAVVANARIAVTTNRSDDQDAIVWSTTGGLIVTDSCTFRNNYKAVQFLLYEYPNKSSFTNTVFETTSQFIDGNSTPGEFVSLFGVQGIGFHGCRFRSLVPDKSKPPDEKHGNGIYSNNASYTINEYQTCPVQIQPCPRPQITRSSFTGLHYGVRAINSDPTYYVNITKTDFDSNYRSVYLGNADYSVITSNTFNIPSWSNVTDSLYCLYLDESTGYSVQENHFNAHKVYEFGTSPSKFIGLIVNNSGSMDNEIYKNDFDSVTWAIIAQDVNRSVDGLTGLRLKCNRFSGTFRDIFVASSEENDSSGIALYQGDSLTMTGPAGNEFSPQHISYFNQAFDIDNEEGESFWYYHHREQLGDPRLKPDYTSSKVYVYEVYDFLFDTTRCCLSKLDEGGQIQEELKIVIEAESDTINNKELQLVALIDGGNTEIMNAEIINSSPPEAMALRNDLLTKSPYLSDTAMQLAISKEDVLPNEMIRDVLVANPHSATSEKVLGELNNRIIPMPDSMMAEIMANENIISAKEGLESELASHKAKRYQAQYNLIRILKNDTTSGSSDSLIELYQNQMDLSLKYQLAFEYLKNGEYVNLENLLSSIPSIFDLDQKQSEIHADYVTLFSILREKHNILLLDSTDTEAVQDLINSSHEPVKSFARNILIAKGAFDYHEPILLPENLKSSKEKKWSKTGKFVENSYMKMFPNPGKLFVIIEYNLKEKFLVNNSTILMIRNLNGTIVFKKTMLKRQDQELINTSSFITGSYICSLIVNGKILESQKLIIE